MAIDALGNLYGNTFYGGANSWGTVYELSPSSGNWALHVLYNLPADAQPHDRVTLDSAGNLFMTIEAGGAYGAGQVFKLTQSNGYWTYADLYDFNSEGYSPVGGVTLDSRGNLYGTTAQPISDKTVWIACSEGARKVGSSALPFHSCPMRHTTFTNT